MNVLICQFEILEREQRNKCLQTQYLRVINKLITAVALL